MQPPLGTPAFGNPLFHPMTAVCRATVCDDGDGLISELISTNVVIEISLITRNDDKSVYQFINIANDSTVAKKSRPRSERPTD